jgi:hypothetical protein
MGGQLLLMARSAFRSPPRQRICADFAIFEAGPWSPSSLDAGSLWGSKWGVYCSVLIVRLEI